MAGFTNINYFDIEDLKNSQITWIKSTKEPSMKI